MVYGCGANTVKCLVVFFNLLSFLAGAALLITCAVAYTNDDIQDKIIGGIEKAGVKDLDKVHSINAILIVGMVLGGILIILGFLGCCGGWMESSCLLVTFAVIMSLIIIVELAIAVALLAFKGQVKVAFQKGVDEAANNTKSQDQKIKEDACNFFADMYDQLKCCGSSSVSDVKSCIDKPFVEKCGATTAGCRDKVWTEFWKVAKTFGIVGIVMLVLELAAIIFACSLICAMRSGRGLYDRV